MKILGYTSDFSALPGESVDVMVSSDVAEYHPDLVKLIHGDTNPDGPGFKVEQIDSELPRTCTGRIQRTHAGSHVRIEDSTRFHNLEQFTLVAMICPTLLNNRAQGLITKWDGQRQTGTGLYINEDNCLEFMVGGETVESVATSKAMLDGVWYLVAATYDRGDVTVVQRPVVSRTNSRFAIATSLESTTDEVRATVGTVPALDNGVPLFIGAEVEETTDELIIYVPGSLFNGKVDSPRLYRTAVVINDLQATIEHPESVPGAEAVWDFETEITADGLSDPRAVTDTSGNGHHGRTVNMPTRAVTGYNWRAKEQNFIHAPREYGAIHFHEDDLDDARWTSDFTFTIPDDLPSALYAFRLRADDDADYVPLYVRPAPGQEKKILFLAPTASYMAYANDHVAMDVPLAQLMTARVPVLQEENITLSYARELGLSTYDHHTDGSGVAFSSRLRPILNMRPGFRHWLSPSLWQFNADLHLIDWMIEMGYEFDVATDFDLHREGAKILEPYNVVLTGTHPEYYSEQMLDSLHAYNERGGRLMYLGANGFYWVTNYDDADTGAVIEVRKGMGNNAWKAAPGEYHLSFTGERGSLWRHRGRAPQRLLGVGFGSEGFDVSEPYFRTPDSQLPEASWMFEGIDDDEPLGNFGLVGGGAAGLELDVYDQELGSPPESLLVAASAGHTEAYAEVTEELFFNVPGTTGTQNARVRGDIVYFPTANGGGVWSVSSIAYAGSLSHNSYDNNISRLTSNVLSRFAEDRPAPEGAHG